MGQFYELESSSPAAALNAGETIHHLHRTIRGRQIAAQGEGAEGQFAISDDRSPEAVAARLRDLGLEPVWKDWDAAILNAA